MAIAFQALAEGYLANALADILPAVPVLTVVPERGLVCHNINAADQTIVIYLNRDGTSRPVERARLAQNETFINAGRYVLEPGDSLRAVTTTAAAVHFTLSGTEVT